MASTNTNLVKRLRNLPTWLIVILIAVLGISLKRVTGNSEITQLLALVVFVLLAAKILMTALRITSFFAKLVLVVMVLAYWLLTSVGFK